MANYYAAARTNYFMVTDHDAFVEALGDAPVEVVRKHRDPDMVAVIATGEGGRPTEVWDQETDDIVEISVCDIIAEHLAPGQVAYGLEVGAEKARYLIGLAWATDGEREVGLGLEDAIREAISREFPGVDLRQVPVAHR